MSDEALPARWLQEAALVDVASFGALVVRVRRLDGRSDAALRALARLAAAGEGEACLVVTVALLPLLVARCGRRRALIAEAVHELAAAMAEPAGESPAGGVANRLLERVVSRVRREQAGRAWQRPVPDPGVVVPPAAAGAGDGCFEARVVDRVALAEFRRRLAGQPRGGEAWAVLAASAAGSGLSSTERSRLARHRRSLRQLAARSLVA